MTIRNIIISSTDTERLIRFWSALLGLQVDKQIGAYTWLQPADERSIVLGFQQIESAQSGTANIHFDVLVDDLDQATSSAIKLGGKLISKQGINNIVADPDGNEFCVYTN